MLWGAINHRPWSCFYSYSWRVVAGQAATATSARTAGYCGERAGGFAGGNLLCRREYCFLRRLAKAVLVDSPYNGAACKNADVM